MQDIGQFFAKSSAKRSNKENESQGSRLIQNTQPETIDLDLDDEDLDYISSQSKRKFGGSIAIEDDDEPERPIKKRAIEVPLIVRKKTTNKSRPTVPSAPETLEEVLNSIPSVNLDGVTTKSVNEFSWKGAHEAGEEGVNSDLTLSLIHI